MARLDPTSKYKDPARAAAFYDDVYRRLAAQPWVDSVGLVTSFPLDSSNTNGTVKLLGPSNAEDISYSAQKV